MPKPSKDDMIKHNGRMELPLNFEEEQKYYLTDLQYVRMCVCVCTCALFEFKVNL